MSTWLNSSPRHASCKLGLRFELTSVWFLCSQFTTKLHTLILRSSMTHTEVPTPNRFSLKVYWILSLFIEFWVYFELSLLNNFFSYYYFPLYLDDEINFFSTSQILSCSSCQRQAFYQPWTNLNIFLPTQLFINLNIFSQLTQ